MQQTNNQNFSFSVGDVVGIYCNHGVYLQGYVFYDEDIDALCVHDNFFHKNYRLSDIETVKLWSEINQK